MASNNLHNSDLPYDPLPASNLAAEHIEMRETPSPRLQTREFDYSPSPTPHPPNIDDLPPGAAVPIPRFYGLALKDEGPRPFDRNSYASSVGTASTQYDPMRGYDASSIHALNPTTEDVTASLRQSSTPTMEESYRDDPNVDRSYFPPHQPAYRSYPLEEKRAFYAAPNKRVRKKGFLIGGIVAGIVLLAGVILLIVYFAVIKKHSSSSGSTSGNSSGGSSGSPSTVSNIVVSGGDGSVVTMEDGTTFTYSNKFGGTWVDDPNDPFGGGAKAQSWSPAINETFNYGIDKIRGVNLGGWLVTEPFIVPALYEKYHNTSNPPVDEWTLTQAMAKANALSDLENHYATFITERDFADIAAAGLNFVRIPLPWWAIEVRGNEPFIPNKSWTYFLKAIQWARKYGIRINLDLHSVPGSQNGWNHSGRLGEINFLFGVAGIFNGQRALEYVRVLAEFISQPQYQDVVAIFGILNEPRSAPYIGQAALGSWYLEAYNIVRNITGTGQGKGPYVSIHDGFQSPASWSQSFPNADRLALDTHPYNAFGTNQNTNPPSASVSIPCQYWGNMMNDSMNSFGLTAAGEFSLGINDCGLWLNGVDLGTRYEGTYAGSNPAVGSCDPWNDWTTWSDSIKKGFKNFGLTSMDALQNYFFWTWKIGNSSITGKVEAPMWSYQLGLQNGWLSDDPRDAEGACASRNIVGNAFKAPLQSWQTGGAGAGNIPASVSNQFPWPPASIMTAISQPIDASVLPTYTPTGTNPTLPPPTLTFASATATASVDLGNGWFNPQDVQGAFVEINGCSYPDPWGGSDIPVPNGPACTGSAKRDSIPPPVITPPP